MTHARETFTFPRLGCLFKKGHFYTERHNRAPHGAISAGVVSVIAGDPVPPLRGFRGSYIFAIRRLARRGLNGCRRCAAWNRPNHLPQRLWAVGLGFVRPPLWRSPAHTSPLRRGKIDFARRRINAVFPFSQPRKCLVTPGRAVEGWPSRLGNQGCGVRESFSGRGLAWMFG